MKAKTVTVREDWYLTPAAWHKADAVMQLMDELVGPAAHQHLGWSGHATFLRGDSTSEPVQMLYKWANRESHRELAEREESLLGDFYGRYCSRPRVITYLTELDVDTDHDTHAPLTPSRDLLGKVAVVTGASKGIGRAIALALAGRGANLAVNYRSDEGAARETADLVRGLGQRAVLVPGDVTNEHAAGRLVEAVTSGLGRLDVLVNNVGEFFFKPLGATATDEWDRVLQSNLASVHYVSRAALAALRRTRGCIVNIGLSPTHQVRAATNVGAYSIAKTGVAIYTRTLAAEEARGVRVNVVSPGLIDNGFLPGPQKAWMEARVPMGRLGTPDEVATAVAFLASPAALYISGANLAVSGGWDWEDRSPVHDGIVERLFGGKEGQ